MIKLRRPRPTSVLAIAFAVAASTLLHPDDSLACGADMPEVVFVRSGGPDLPPERTLDGAVGIIDARYDIDELAIAYRHFVGLGFDPRERESVIAAHAARRTSYHGDTYATPWLEARRRVISEDHYIATGYSGTSYDFVQNCNADAFARAAATLDARVRATSRTSPEVQRFVAAQDLVFLACSRSERSEHMPPPGDTVRERNDRAYQTAARAFYLGDLAGALAGFEAIAANASSEWRFLARYLVARVHQRRAFEEEGAWRDGLEAAVRTLDGILADPTMAQWHAPARDYRDFVMARLDPSGRFRELTVSVAARHHGEKLGTMLSDLRWLEKEDSFARVPNADRFAVFVATIRDPGPASAARAATLERQTGSPAFLVAALLAAPTLRALPAADVERLLERAAALPASHPAYATALAHRARLLLGREGVDRRAMYRALITARDALGHRRGASVAHALTLLAFAYATTVDEALATSGAATTVTNREDPYEPDQTPDTAFDFHAYGKRFFDRLPLATWARVAQGTALPADARAELATVAYARALVTDDTRTRRALAPVVAARFPEAAALIRAVESATDDDARRYARIWLLLHASSMRFELDELSEVADRGFTSGARYYCEPTSYIEDEGSIAHAISASVDRNEARLVGDSASPSRASLSRLAPAGAFLAREAVAAATARPNDPRNPELLARAVRATRWACGGEGTRAASRDAFRMLHARYPNSPEARETRHFYGDR